jgi:hypothetical protein
MMEADPTSGTCVKYTSDEDSVQHNILIDTRVIL